MTEVSRFAAQGGFQDFEKVMRKWRDSNRPAGRPTFRRKKNGTGKFLTGAGVQVLCKVNGNRLKLLVMGV